jgi:peptidoglycan/LPS O-acetylase OafA/YrhL
MHYRIFSTWRLAAALVIMLYHFCHYGPEGARDIIEHIERMLPMLDMFFIISGYLIFDVYRDRIGSPREYYDYIVRRFARIYPLHIATLGFFIAIAVAGHFGLVKTGGASRYDLSQVLPNLLLVQSWGVTRELSLNYVSWSLSAEWFCYLAFPLIVLFFRKGGATGLVLLFAGMIALLEGLSYAGLVPFRSWLLADTWGAYRAFVDFVAGALIATVVTNGRFTLRSHWPAWLLLGAAIISMQMKWPAYVSYFLVIIALFLAAVCERNAPERAAWLDFAAPAAAVSFGIYMWHPVIETLVYTILWPRLVGWISVDFYLFMLLPMALSVFVAWLSSRTYERWTGRWISAKLRGLVRPPAQRIPAAAE